MGHEGGKGILGAEESKGGGGPGKWTRVRGVDEPKCVWKCHKETQYLTW